MHSWIVALRFARREVRRAKGRTALIVAMIGLPIGALSFVAAIADMAMLTPSEHLARDMGTASASIEWSSDRIAQSLHSAANVDGVGAAPSTHTATDVLALLPAGSTVSQSWEAPIAMHTAGGIGTLSANGIDTTSPLTAGMVRVVDGRTPRAADEVALSPQALARLGARVGGTVHTVASNTPFTVVGTVEVGGHIDETMLFATSEPPGSVPSQTNLKRWLVGQATPVLGDEVRALNQHGIFVTSRALVLHPPPRPLVHVTGSDVQAFGVTTLLVGLAVLEVVLLAGPAFAVGARRRQRELALVAAAGGAPSTLRRIVLADGVVCGVIASVVGLALGLGLAFGGRGMMEASWSDSRFGGYRIYPWAVLGVVGVAVVIGLLGALLPALSAGRQDIVASLSGRRGVAHASRRWLVAGVVFVAVGVALAVFGAYRDKSGAMLAGLAIVEFGLVMCTPAFVGVIARLGRFLPVAPRLALRDAARRRAAAAPAIAAVMAAVAGSVAISVYVTGQRAANPPVYERSLPMGTVSMTTMDANTGEYVTAPVASLERVVHTVLPNATAIPVQILSCRGASPTGLCNASQYLPDDRRCPFQPWDVLSKVDQRRALADRRCDALTLTSAVAFFGSQPIVTDSRTVVAAVSGLVGHRLEAATAVLRAGGILVSDPEYVENGKALLAWDDGTGKSHPDRVLTVPAYAVDTDVRWDMPVYSPKIVADEHNTTVSAGILATPERVPSQADADALDALTLNSTPEVSLYVERGFPYSSDDKGSVSLLLAAAAAAIALAAAAIATGLAAADSRRDLITLGAVGATPRVRRILSLAQAAVISGTGSLIGVVVGFGAAAAILTGLNQQWATIWPKPAHYPITVPWLNIGIALVAVPLVAMLGAGLLTRSRLPSERRAD